MIRNSITSAAAIIAASLSLAACGGADEAASADNAANNVVEVNAAAALQELPPSIAASRTYRCRDNSLVYVDFFTNNTAQIRTSEAGERIQLAATEGNPPFTAEGYSVSANAETASIAVPGKGAQSCNAGG
jgi:hypothetical protein